MWGPQDSVQLVNITTISLGFIVVITIVRWGYKPTYNVLGAPHCDNVAEGYVQGDIAANCPGAPSPLRAVQQVSAQFAGDCEDVQQEVWCRMVGSRGQFFLKTRRTLRGHLVWTCFFICMCWDPVNQHVFFIVDLKMERAQFQRFGNHHIAEYNDHTATWLNPPIEIISYDPYFVHEILTMLVECCLQPLWGKLHFYRAVLTIPLSGQRADAGSLWPQEQGAWVFLLGDG